MHLRSALVIAFFLGSTSLPGFALAGASKIETTQRKIQGIITAVEPTSLTIAPMHKGHTVTGRVDAKKTTVLVDGKPSKIADLRITYTAKAELGLDDVWVTVRADSTP